MRCLQIVHSECGFMHKSIVFDVYHVYNVGVGSTKCFL
jgi:hypothetical protein